MIHCCTRRQLLKTGLAMIPGIIVGTRVWGALSEFSIPLVDLEFIESQMKLVRRWEWSQTMPKTSLLRAAGTYDRLTVHHSGALVNSSVNREDAVAHIDGILTGHIERGYGDIGYHFIIDRSGCVWEGRSLAYEGAHVYGENERNVGVVLLGNFEEQLPSDKQLASMTQIVTLLCERYRVKHQRVYGHRDLASSVCPGKHLYSYAHQLRDKIVA
jgi:hypothetical protein